MKLECLPGMTATVRVDRQDLQEFASDEVTENTGKDQVRYVEAETGADFSVVLVAGKGFPYHDECIAVSVDVDGQRIANRKLVEGYFLENDYSCSTRSTTRGSDTIVERLSFAKVETIDELDPDDVLARYKELGEIVVTVRRSMLRPMTEAELKTEKERCLDPAIVETLTNLPDVIPEKGLKGRAISARTAFKIIKAYKTPAARPATHKYTLPHGRSPVAVYRFRYRTRRDLQTEWIVPRDSASPSPKKVVKIEILD